MAGIDEDIPMHTYIPRPAVKFKLTTLIPKQIFTMNTLNELIIYSLTRKTRGIFLFSMKVLTFPGKWQNKRFELILDCFLNLKSLTSDTFPKFAFFTSFKTFR